MAIDRSRFKTMSTSAMKQQSQTVATMTGQGNRAGYLDMDDGLNRVRIYPIHPNGGESWIYPKTVHWLPKEIDDDGKKEIKNRPVFNSRVHGGTEMDIVEQYIAFVTQLINQKTTDVNERAKLLEPVTDWKKGIGSKTSWVMYAHKISISGAKEFGRLEVPPSVKEKLNDIAGTETSSESIVTDPFTDIADGKAVHITYTPKEKPAKKYKVTIEFRSNYALTDQELEHFEKQEPLSKMFEYVYTRKDFDTALRGLQIFDNENKFGVFSHDAFLDICDTIQSYYPEEGAKEEVEGTDDESGVSEESGDENEKAIAETDQFDSMDRKALKEYIKLRKLNITVLPTYVDEQIREMIRESEAEKYAVKSNKPERNEEEDEQLEKESDLPFDKKDDKKKSNTAVSSSSKPSTTSRLSTLRSKTK